jgi:hypothetical protein
MGRIKVLFLHALEAGPGSMKHKYLEASFDVRCPQLRSGTWMMRLRILAGVLLALLIALWTATWVVWWFFFRDWIGVWAPIVIMGVSLVLLVGLFILLKRLFLRMMLDGAVAAANQEFSEFRPDIIVGQSFGTSVALRMKKEVHQTPLLLLSPANHLFNSHAGIWEEPDLSPFPFVTVVHGDDDTLIPLEHSVKLTSGSKQNNYLEVIPMEDHRLMSLGEFELRELVHTTLFKVDPELASSSMWSVPLEQAQRSPEGVGVHRDLRHDGTREARELRRDKDE